uniref:acyl-CoA dehydrogenase C-terminal domain-containing protein n=1 Tax=Nocardia asiatica TaxID=209252 RepID=UPI00245600A8
RAYQYLTESLQTLGGSGFLQDYPIEQYIRDAKIDSLYEGTTAIQAQDFFFRKIIRDKGVALGHVNARIAAFLDAKTGRFGAERELLRTAAEDVQAMAATLTGFLMAAQQTPTELYKIGLGSVRFLLAVGDLLIGWRLLVQAEIAAAALAADAPEKDRAFYAGKVAVARFFATNVLPNLTAVRGIIAALDNDIMNLEEDGF